MAGRGIPHKPVLTDDDRITSDAQNDNDKFCDNKLQQAIAKQSMFQHVCIMYVEKVVAMRPYVFVIIITMMKVHLTQKEGTPYTKVCGINRNERSLACWAGKQSAQDEWR